MRTLKALFGLLAPLLLALTCFSASKPPPNIIFILADDLGWSDVGCYGSTFYETPNIDALASRGMRFLNAYAACCVCSPTRASILTGKYPARLQLTDWLPGQPDKPEHKLRRPTFLDHLPEGEVTIAAALKNAGYETACMGKWHLGGPEFAPEKFGFDVNIGGCKLGHPPSYFSPYKIPALKDGPAGEYLTDRLTQEAVDFIKASKDKPFFLYLAHYAVHKPLEAKPELIEKYKTKAALLRQGEQKVKANDTPEFRPEGKMKTRLIQNQPVYAAMVQSVDESVGRIMQELKTLGLLTNTVVIFTSDNGGLSTAEGTPTSNEPLRAGKGWPYEGGIREPLILQWPRHIEAGSISPEMVISADFYPTFLQIAGLPLRPEQHLDGITLIPALKGFPANDRPLFWHYPHYSNQGAAPYGVVRVRNMKLIEWYEDMRVELFNLQQDPGEKHDLATEQPEIAASLRNQLHQWRESVHAAMPTPNPEYKAESTTSRK
jgi:arylsulfatase A-like enzyme